MGRMAVGRFPDRAAALAFLCEKYPLDRKNLEPEDADAQHSHRESKGVTYLTFRFSTKLEGGKAAVAQYNGTGADLSAAIVDVFKQLGESIAEKEKSDA